MFCKTFPKFQNKITECIGNVLYAVIQQITDIHNSTLVSTARPLGKLNSPWSKPLLSKPCQKLALGREHGNTTVSTLTDVHIVTCVHCNVAGSVQFPLAPTMLPKHPQELPLGCEDLDTMVTAVGYVRLPSAVTGYTTGVTQLSFPTAFLDIGPGEGKVRVQNLNAMVARVDHVKVVSISDVYGRHELERSAALGANRCEELAFRCELLNAIIVVVSNKICFPRCPLLRHLDAEILPRLNHVCRTIEASCLLGSRWRRDP